MAWAKRQTGITRSLGAGARYSIQGKNPSVGAIGSLKGRIPHAVVVTAVNGENITFKESNYAKGWITQRTLPLSQFLGFVYN